jgi:hypothetical protein
VSISKIKTMFLNIQLVLLLVPFKSYVYIVLDRAIQEILHDIEQNPPLEPKYDRSRTNKNVPK